MFHGWKKEEKEVRAGWGDTQMRGTLRGGTAN